MANTATKVGFAAVPLAAILAVAAILAQPDHEKRVLVPYWDSLGGVWTVCAGVTGEDVIRDKTYTDAECEALETRYLSRMYARMGRCVPNARLEFHEVKAWGHFVYNIDETNFCHSTAAKLLNEGRNAEACKQIPRWRFVKGKDCAIRSNKCYGIVKRRQWEQTTCEAGP